MSASNQLQRILIFIVAYNAARTVKTVLHRIPEAFFKDPRYEAEILIIDDSSKDLTFDLGLSLKSEFNLCPLTVLKNPVNLGYGGNQKLGYHYAIERNFSVVALLHGDGQYAPEQLPNLIEPLINSENSIQTVFGSRMLTRFAALKGGMPFHKYFGNKVLTFIQNKLVGITLSEWHSGYRIYSCEILKKIPFELNSDGFDFDTDIILQLTAVRSKILELPIPTYYGEEISYVNVLQYGCKILLSCLLYRIQGFSLLYDPKFDLATENNQYQAKFDFDSSHSRALKQVKKEDTCLIVACGPLPLVKPFAERATSLALSDLYLGPELKALNFPAFAGDLDKINLDEQLKEQSFSKVLALDIIEHLKSPENFCKQIRESTCCRDAEIIITTPNIAFLPVRLMLFFGFFNYGKRGILDLTHTRLYTFSSLRRLLKQSGFDILEMSGIPAPFPLAIGSTWLASLLLKLNALACKILPGLFSYQIFVRAKAKPTIKFLLSEAHRHSELEARKVRTHK